MQNKREYQDTEEYSSTPKTVDFAAAVTRQLMAINQAGSIIGDNENDSGEISRFISAVGMMEINLWGYVYNNNTYHDNMRNVIFFLNTAFNKIMLNPQIRAELHTQPQNYGEYRKKYYDYPLAKERLKNLMIVAVDKVLAPARQRTDVIL